METEDLFLFPGALKPFSLLQHVCRIYYCRTVGAGVWGVEGGGAHCPHPQFLADQLTLSKSGGQITDKRTDAWFRPSCIYTQIFSPRKKLVFPP